MTNFSSLASAAGLSGTQYKLRYEQSSCRLELTGLPDVTATASAGQPQQQLNILTGWDLNLGQKASLQGKREHLQALVSAVQPYVRLLVSAQPCQQSGGNDAVGEHRAPRRWPSPAAAALQPAQHPSLGAGARQR